MPATRFCFFKFVLVLALAMLVFNFGNEFIHFLPLVRSGQVADVFRGLLIMGSVLMAANVIIFFLQAVRTPFHVLSVQQP